MSTNEIWALVFGAVAAVSGWLLVHHRPTRVSGALLLAGGSTVLLGDAGSLLGLGPVVPVLCWLGGAFLLPLSFATYPTLRWRDPLSFVLLATIGGAGSVCVLWPEAFKTLGWVLGFALVVHVWWGHERGGTEERRALSWAALAWVGAGMVILFVGFMTEAADANDWNAGGVAIALASVGPLAMVIGGLRPELVDVRGLITRAVVAGTTLAVVVAVGSATAAVVEQVRGQPLQATPIVVLVAFLGFGIHPLQVVLRGVVDQLLFGDRPDPLAAATVLADRIGDDPALALHAIREALVLPYASLRVEGTELASSGSEVTHTRSLPLRLGEHQVGEFVLGLRPGDLGLSNADADVLKLVAPLLAQTLRAQAMTRDLQQSREAVVTAVEEERRRLRRDLHDGLGPTLTGVAFATDAARNQVRSDPDRAVELLETLRADTAGAITEIRRLVEGLRPPALDQVGLLGSVRQYADTLHSADGSRLEVVITAPELPPLPAATEVAAYRILVEALTNTARHAAARRAAVDLEVRGHDLHLLVSDDGRSGAGWKPGVGITSMRERAHQVGGSVRVTLTPRGGVVEASIPLVRTAS